MDELCLFMWVLWLQIKQSFRNSCRTKPFITVGIEVEFGSTLIHGPRDHDLHFLLQPSIFKLTLRGLYRELALQSCTIGT